MEYVKTEWKDRVVQYLNRYQDQDGNLVTLTQQPGQIAQTGTPVNAENLNKIEDGIAAMCEELNKPKLTIITEANTNCDDYVEDGDYSFELEYTPVGAPFGAVNGKLKVRHITADTIRQTWYRKGTANVNDQELGYRSKIGNVWSNWQRNLTSKEVVNNLTSDREDLPLSAAQGKVLNARTEYEKITSGSYNDLLCDDPYHPKKYRVEGTLTDGPSTNWGWLDVYCTVANGGTYKYVQVFVADTGIMYIRIYNNSWGNWLKSANGSDIESINQSLKAPTLPNNANFDNYTNFGIWYCASSNTYMGIPNGVVNGWLIILEGISTGGVKQIFLRHGSATTHYHTYVRTYTGGKWEGWNRYATIDELDSKIANEHGNIFYSSGDTWSMAKGAYGGFITSSTKRIQFSVPVALRTADVKTATITDGNFVLRGISGYLDSNSSGINYNASGYTVTAEIEGGHSLLITIDKNTAFTNVTNNTSVSVYITGLNVKFS